MKAVLHYRAGHRFRQRLAALDGDWLHSVVIEASDEEVFRREMADAEVLLHVLERVTAAAIDAARRRGIAVCNSRGPTHRRLRR